MKFLLVFTLLVGIFLPIQSQQETGLAEYVAFSLDKVLDWLEILFRNIGKGAEFLEKMLMPKPGTHIYTPVLTRTVRAVKNVANSVADALHKPEEEKRDLTPAAPLKRVVRAIFKVAPPLIRNFFGEMVDTLIYYIPEVKLTRCVYRYVEQEYPKFFASLLDSKITIIRVGAKGVYYVVKFLNDSFGDDKDLAGREATIVSVYRNDRLGKLHDVVSYLKSYIREIFYMDADIKGNLNVEHPDEEVVNLGMCFKVYSMELLFRFVEIFM